MAGVIRKSLLEPEELIEFPLATQGIVELGDLTVGRFVAHPGWRWSKHVRPEVGGEWCRARHVGVMISGRIRFITEDGTELEVGPDEAYDVPPGHDAYVVGDEPVVQIEWQGLRTFLGPRGGARGRRLVTLLFTDIVDSTRIAASLGDASWRELLTRHYEAARTELDRFGGRETKTTGDGILAVFDTPAAALRCADAIRSSAARDDLRIRAGVHVGEVSVVGGSVEGLAVHEAARIMAAAGAQEILTSELTRGLVAPSGIQLEDRGIHSLKGLEGEHRLFAYVTGSSPQ
ncbi:MAG TPA: adenylate/guanylate cyclase domain-containing protein [Actinomycetota bacterium]|nr:adenylate/guanylate cyclase domain-containing protein [Actinomycetota bacterium]